MLPGTDVSPKLLVSGIMAPMATTISGCGSDSSGSRQE